MNVYVKKGRTYMVWLLPSTHDYAMNVQLGTRDIDMSAVF